MRSITAEEVADTLIREWTSRFGVPAIITTDQGTQFESDLFRRLTQTLSSKRIRTTAYHPCANGMIERVHRQLKAALMCHSDSWLQALPLVLLGMRTAFKEDLKATAAEMLYGESLRLPGEMLTPVPDRLENPADYVTQLRKKMAALRPVPASRHSEPAIFVSKALASASHVFLRDDTVRRPLQPPYSGPFEILSRSADGKTLALNIKGKRVVVSVDRVKPAFLLSPDPEPHDQPKDSTAPTSPTPAVPSDDPKRTVAKGLSGQPAAATAPTGLSPTSTTRSGRKVKFSKRENFFYF